MSKKNSGVEASVDKKVCNRSINDWIEAWHRWYLSIPEKRHPIFAHLSREFERRQDQNQGRLTFLRPNEVKTSEECDERVWFLTGGYQGVISTRSFIPPGDFYILAPLYTVWASSAEYPSLNTNEKLNEFCSNEIKEIDLKESILDGNNISSYHIKIDKPFDVDLPAGNILGLPSKSKSKNTIRLVSNGHWIWLKPLSIGDHRIHLSASTDGFVTELNIALSVAGPKK